VAGPGATPDASPSATVLLAVAMIWLLPQVEDACRVAGDAVLEGQQGVPLVWYAGRAGIGVGMSGHEEEEAAGGGCLQKLHQLGACWATHGWVVDR